MDRIPHGMEEAGIPCADELPGPSDAHQEEDHGEDGQRFDVRLLVWLSGQLDAHDELVDEHHALDGEQPDLASTAMVGVASEIPGMRANSATTSASVRAENATPARMSISTRCWRPGAPGATEMATKSSPMSAPATPALAAKNEEKSEGTEGTDAPAQVRWPRAGWCLMGCSILGFGPNGVRRCHRI